MAYSQSNLGLIGYSAGTKVWLYSSTDAASVIAADTDYFDDQVADFNAGDVMIIVDTSSHPAIDLCQISAADETSCVITIGT